MTNSKIKAPYSIMESKQYKLFDFCTEFSEFRQFDYLSRFGYGKISENLERFENKGRIYFKNRISFCPDCHSKKVVKNGIYERKLIFLRIGEKLCIIQKYKCKKCGKIFYTDLSSLVYPNSNIIFPVVNCIRNLYSIYGRGLHKICFDLKQNTMLKFHIKALKTYYYQLKSKFKIKQVLILVINYLIVFGFKSMVNGTIFWYYSTLN